MAEKIIKEIKVYEVLSRELYYSTYFSSESYVFVVYGGEDVSVLRKFFLLDFTGDLNLSETGVFPCTINERPKKIYAKLVGNMPVGTCFSDLFIKSTALGPSEVDTYIVSCTESLGIPDLLPWPLRQDIGTKVFSISRFVLDKLFFSEE